MAKGLRLVLCVAHLESPIYKYICIYGYLPPILLSLPRTWVRSTEFILQTHYFCTGPICANAAKTYTQAFWLGHFGHYMPKRSCLWSNSALIRCLDRGQWLTRRKKKNRKSKNRKQSSKNGVVQYVDKKGRKKCHGTPQLKRSQQLGCHFICSHFKLEWSTSSEPPTDSIRGYPAKYARKLVDLLPMFRCSGSMRTQVPEATAACACLGNVS